MVLLSLLFVAQIADYPPDTVAGIPVNYTEAQAGAYTLPDPLVMANGKPVKDAKTWMAKRRPEILRAIEAGQFGRQPKAPAKLSYDVFDKGTPALAGQAIRRQVTIHLSSKHSMDVLLYLPAAAPPGKKSPVLLNVSFTANSNVVDDPGIKPGEVWNPKEKKRVPAASGRSFGKLNIAPFLAEGVGVATVYYGDIDPDFEGGLALGIRSAHPAPGPGDWGSISAWAWGLSRVLDYFERDAGVDAKRVGIVGISRLGKTVLWTGASDPRFALVIASCSGEGGAALSRRNYGELVKHLNVRYGYQFAENYKKHGDRVSDLPFDAHMLISLIAPRPLLLQTGNTDKWSDPRGEFLAAKAATPVYALFGKPGATGADVPPAGEPVLNPLGYFMHAGGHGTIPSDWAVFLRFLKLHL